eukprot:SAG31_NODE_28771_length_405_cov_0.869281_1_plen_50_part_01
MFRAGAKLETQQLKMTLDHELQTLKSEKERLADSSERDALDRLKADCKKQ